MVVVCGFVLIFIVGLAWGVVSGGFCLSVGSAEGLFVGPWGGVFGAGFVSIGLCCVW